MTSFLVNIWTWWNTNGQAIANLATAFGAVLGAGGILWGVILYSKDREKERREHELELYLTTTESYISYIRSLTEGSTASKAEFETTDNGHRDQLAIGECDCMHYIHLFMLMEQAYYTYRIAGLQNASKGWLVWIRYIAWHTGTTQFPQMWNRIQPHMIREFDGFVRSFLPGGTNRARFDELEWISESIQKHIQAAKFDAAELLQNKCLSLSLDSNDCNATLTARVGVASPTAGRLPIHRRVMLVEFCVPPGCDPKTDSAKPGIGISSKTVGLGPDSENQEVLSAKLISALQDLHQKAEAKIDAFLLSL